MTSSRRGQSPLTISLPPAGSSSHLPELPPIDALFLIDFDVKKGYTIAWQQTAPGVNVDGRVEYKSLPSGLHTVSEDLIYFVHEGAHAGLSAFVNVPCEEEESRHARMIAVGVLVPLSYGRLGRAWRHAQGLKDLANELAKDRTNTELLDTYWKSNKLDKDDPKPPATSGETPVVTPAVTFSEPNEQPQRKGHYRNRSGSDRTSLAPAEHRLSPYHPAWRLTSLLDKFGPLIFPIHRAALLRQRILISCHTPVQEICDFVYNLSILSNVPLSLTNILPEHSPTQRLRPLFTIGVHDIPFLTEDYEALKRRGQRENAIDDDLDDETGTGWVACTTDSILAMKDTLWDMLITMPPEHSSHAKDKVWPTVECPKGVPIRATQRDLRRFNTLRAGLFQLADTPSSPNGVRASTSHSNRSAWHFDHADDSFDKVIEPLSWAALAYNGYMWWASAGEQLHSEEQEETSRDTALLADLTPHTPTMTMPTSRSDPTYESLASLAALRHQKSTLSAEADEARVELAIVAYFHRLTTQMLSVMSDIIEDVDEAYPDNEHNGTPTEEGDALLDDSHPQPRAVMVDSRSVENMGLDVWSDADAAFVKDLMRVYFDRLAKVEGKGVEVCGVRVC
ncbi:uncharacterized protein F5Z01DRAFT_702744 [Emericellopsis atlantica]|uniref:DUF4484 domain-containing protein n=1 Tax=Emericellopsis atlantica TaxID=2614577 RepID=A0A9P7ZRS1_9HYPO|nr:uncharacterized protein F5Z01DRAFT_702744 [Emericellopsis atlantica]KAG9257109.1 hypothetical protein F5Z01DRAFT_702744 [Emericellopsis atlantica]